MRPRWLAGGIQQPRVNYLALERSYLDTRDPVEPLVVAYSLSIPHDYPMPDRTLPTPQVLWIDVERDREHPMGCCNFRRGPFLRIGSKVDGVTGLWSQPPPLGYDVVFDLHDAFETITNISDPDVDFLLALVIFSQDLTPIVQVGRPANTQNLIGFHPQPTRRSILLAQHPRRVYG